jgi:hypothetical protein
VARGPVRLLTDRDPVHRGGTLDASGRVDDVAGDESLPLLRVGADRDHRLAGINAHPHLQVEIRIGPVQLRDRFEDAQSGPYRPLDVVLVGHRSPESGHDGVTDELLDRAAAALDLLTQAGMVGADSGAHVLRILLLGGSRETHQVAEEDRDDLPLLQRGSGCDFTERRSALVAEFRPLGVLLAAARADHHEPSLGHDSERQGRLLACCKLGEPVSGVSSLEVCVDERHRLFLVAWHEVPIEIEGRLDRRVAEVGGDPRYKIMRMIAANAAATIRRPLSQFRQNATTTHLDTDSDRSRAGTARLSATGFSASSSSAN